MRIGIYHDVGGSGYGGSECLVVVAATLLARDHEVEIIHHKRDLTPELMRRLFAVDLAGVRLAYAEPEGEEVSFHRPLSRYRAQNETGLRKRIRRVYAEWEWSRRMTNYQVVLSNSSFTQRYLRQWWGLESRVVWVPAETDFGRRDKSPLILSVGRFASGGTSKNQLEMAEAFRGLASAGLAHGVSGFLWSSLSELREHTARLIADPRLRATMAEAARVRAAQFSRAAFETRLLEALRPLLVEAR
jgi:glycosyltransferase involved in cell wall biosynthesis